MPAADPAAVTTEAEPAPCAPQPEDPEGDTLTAAEPVPDPATAQAAADGVEAHCSQNAGDQQYQDPFAGSEPPGAGNGGKGGSSQGAGDSSSPSTGTTGSGDLVASQGTVTDPATGAATDSAGPSLPDTGLGLGGLVALGLPLLAGGIALRLRLA